jgi:hypothetical protein
MIRDCRGECPLCGEGSDLDYGDTVLDGEEMGYKFTCTTCGKQGIEWYHLSYVESVIK